MKIYCLLFISLFITFTVQAQSVSQRVSDKPSINIFTFQASPWVEQNNGQLSGIAIEHLKAVEAQLPYQFIIHVLPVKRAFSQAINSNVIKTASLGSAVFPCSATEDRAADFSFSEQFEGGEATLFTPHKKIYNNKYRGLEKLKQYRSIVVGTLSGHVLEEDLIKENINHITTTSPDQLIKMMEVGRVDIIYLYKSTYVATLRKNKALAKSLLADNKIYPYVIKNLNYGFCFNKNHSLTKKHIETINQAILNTSATPTISP